MLGFLFLMSLLAIDILLLFSLLLCLISHTFGRVLERFSVVLGKRLFKGLFHFARFIIITVIKVHMMSLVLWRLIMHLVWFLWVMGLLRNL